MQCVCALDEIMASGPEVAACKEEHSVASNEIVYYLATEAPVLKVAPQQVQPRMLSNTIASHRERAFTSPERGSQNTHSHSEAKYVPACGQPE